MCCLFRLSAITGTDHLSISDKSWQILKSWSLEDGVFINNSSSRASCHLCVGFVFQPNFFLPLFVCAFSCSILLYFLKVLKRVPRPSIVSPCMITHLIRRGSSPSQPSSREKRQKRSSRPWWRRPLTRRDRGMSLLTGKWLAFFLFSLCVVCLLFILEIFDESQLSYATVEACFVFKYYDLTLIFV